MKNRVIIFFILIPLTLAGQFQPRDPIKGMIVKRFYYQEGELAHPQPTPDGRFFIASSPTYHNLYLISSITGNIQLLSKEQYSGYYWSFSTKDNSLIFLSKSEDAFTLHVTSILNPMVQKTQYSIKNVRQLLNSKSQLPVIQYTDGSFSIWMENQLHSGLEKDTVCFHTDDRIIIKSQHNSTTLSKQTKGVIITAIPSPDFKQVVFQESGQNLYLWKVEVNSVQFLGRGEHPSWNKSMTSIIAMVPEDDGYRITSSKLVIFSLSDGTIHELIPSEHGLWMNPYYLPDGNHIVVEDRSTGELALIKLEVPY